MPILYTLSHIIDKNISFAVSVIRNIPLIEFNIP